MDAKNFESKIYCCSNSPRSEAKILGIVDVVLNLMALSFMIWLTDVVKNHPEYYRNITESSNSSFSDFGFLRNMDKEYQDFYLSTGLIWFGWGMILGGVLFYAAQKSRIGLLKVWFIIIFFSFMMSVFIGVIWIIKSRWKITTTAIILMDYLYVGYKLWIVFALVRELQPLYASTISDSTWDSAGVDSQWNSKNKNPSNPALVIVSPTTTPDPGSVFTISRRESASKKLNDERRNIVENDVTIVQPIKNQDV